MTIRVTQALSDLKRLYLEEVEPNDISQRLLIEELEQINEYKKTKLDPVGKEDADIDNDGNVDKSDSYLKNRRKKISDKIEAEEDEDEEDEDEDDEDSDEAKEIKDQIKKYKKSKTPNSDESADKVLDNMKAISGLKPPVKESAYYNWRDSIDENILWEILDNENKKQVKEKKVNNYSGKSPVVTISPDLETEDSQMTEEFIQESINIATDYLVEEGLNGDDIRDLIENLGQEEFMEWVLELGRNTLLEYSYGGQGNLLTTKGQARKNPKADNRAGSTSALESKPEPKKEKKPEPTTAKGQLSIDYSKPAPKPLPPGQQRIVNAVKNTAAQVTSKDNIKKSATGFADTVARGALSAWEGHKAAMAAKKGGKGLVGSLGAGARATVGSFFKKGTKHFKEWVEYLVSEGYDLSEYTWDELEVEFDYLVEEYQAKQLTEKIISYIRENR